MSAPDDFAPCALRLRFRGPLANPAAFASELLVAIAKGCEGAGASLIGHIKCYGRSETEGFHCNLTSLRSGSRCSATQGRPSDALDLDLAALVFGVDTVMVRGLVIAAADEATSVAGITWSLVSAGHHHNHSGLG